MLDVLPGVVAANPTEPVLALPARYIVKRRATDGRMYNRLAGEAE